MLKSKPARRRLGFYKEPGPPETPALTKRNDTGNNGKKKAGRHRAALACEECRARKRRCDGGTPACSGCVKRLSVCVYASVMHAKAWRDSMIHSLRTRLEELEHGKGLPANIDSGGPDPTGYIQDSTAPPSPRLEDDAIKVISDDTRSLHMPQPTSQITSPVVSRAQQDLSSIEQPRESPGDVAFSRSSGYLGRNSELCGVDRLMKPIDKAISSTSSHNPYGNASPLSETPKSHDSVQMPLVGCACGRLWETSRSRLPLRQHADDLVYTYFTRVHRMYPILHERTFRKYYQCFWHSTATAGTMSYTGCSGLCQQKSQGKTFPAMVHAIFALASLFQPGTSEENKHNAEEYFRLVQEIDLLDILGHEVGIELIQLGLLMGFYLQSTERFSKCWNITGLTIRMAQNMGLQLSLSEARRKGLFAPHATQLECEMRIRAWHGCVLLDRLVFREISMSFGRPLMIATAGEAVQLPEAIDDDRLSEVVGGWNCQLSNIPSLLEPYVQTIKLYDILKQVLDREELTDSSDICLDIHSILRLDTMIMEWRDALPSYLRYDPLSTQSHAASTNMDSQANFAAQATRLQARFLHVRVLILRPALDLLFQKQQQSPLTSNRGSIEQRVQDLIVCNIATQCALSAHNLVNLLHTQIQTHNLVAWWYNISYLHTGGSTLLMARMCTLDNSDLSQEFPRSWELCLQCIARYTGVSSIAARSFWLLQESANRLLPNNTTKNTQLHVNFDQQPSEMKTDSLPLENGPANGEDRDWNCPQSRSSGEDQPAPELIPEPRLDETNLPLVTGALWNHDASLDSYWSFMPFLSQLETLPSTAGSELPDLQ
ncbi:fungal-specific transcription factor domain-containing protein [Aspergillus bertholletiae]|uniref:Fungal-specific transcription factor domain-containing protein n=1 Tax=Aspergillus bertholletiae TaxID=1226010 RepID=A0A5N7BPG3_9EURO|nr:fungal-specific transcription factor domain-containing protein [Aspergillus bertholletiae]